jgi:hypothetical protein
MAGNNQSVNLQGMLNELAGSFNGMGDAYNFVPNAIRNVTRPSVSMDDSTSLTNYAAWARRNGFDEEAARYEALAYRQKEKEVQEAKDAALGKTMAEATQTSSDGQLLGAGGDLGGADATIAVLNKRLSDPEIQKNPRAVEAIQREIATLQSKRPDYEVKNVQAIAQGVAKMDQNIAALNPDDPDYAVKKANFEAARSRFLAQPGVEEAYEGNKLKLMELNNQKMDAMWKAKSPAIIAEMSAAGTNVDELEAIEDKYPQFAPQIVAIKGQMAEQAERLAEVRDKQFRVDQLPSRIEQDLKDIDESTMSEEQKKFARDLLAGASNAVAGGSEYKDSAISAYEKAMTQINQMRGNELAAQAGVERQRTERAIVEAEKAAVAARKGPELADVIALVEAKTGDDWDDIDVDEQRKLAEEAERELMGPLLDYWERANIAAGLEPYKEFDAEDVQTVKAEIREQAKKDKEAGIPVEPYEVSIQRKAYELAAEGYNKDAVIGLLSKETTLSLAQAEEYYEQIMADIEVSDARIAALVEESIQTGGGAGSVAGKVYAETARTRSRGNRTVDPNAVSDDHATRTRALLSDPDNRWQGITLTPQRNKLAEAYAEQGAGRGFRYPSMSELQPISSSNRRR